MPTGSSLQFFGLTVRRTGDELAVVIAVKFLDPGEKGEKGEKWDKGEKGERGEERFSKLNAGVGRPDSS